MKQEERSYTVYMHKNIINDKKYIGITCKSPRLRWRNGEGYKRCTKFWNAIKKYGWNNFKHLILQTDLSKEEAELLEIILINMYNTTDSKYGYNIATGGRCGNNGLKRSKEFCEKMSIQAKNRTGKKHPLYGKHHSQETKIKIGNKSRGRLHSIEDKIKMSNNSTIKRKIICVNTGEIFNSIKDASIKYDIFANHISAVCKGKRHTTGGLIFRYYE